MMDLRIKRVLIVEDDANNMKLLKELLFAIGFGVLEARNGREGVDLAIKEGPDLIIMDYLMPVMDGIQATKLIKADPRCKGVPLVMLTASAMLGDRERMMRAGCDAYISKPIDFAEFKTLVAEFTKMEETDEQETGDFGR